MRRDNSLTLYFINHSYISQWDNVYLNETVEEDGRQLQDRILNQCVFIKMTIQSVKPGSLFSLGLWENATDRRVTCIDLNI